MSKISYYENLIQEKRKKTPFRDFVMQLASWNTLNIYKRDTRITRYPEKDRVKLMGEDIWTDALDKELTWNEEKGDFFYHFKKLIDTIKLQYLLDFGNNENCTYADSVFGGAKNIYLSFVTGYTAENIAYSAYCYTNVSDIFNSFFCCDNNSDIFMSASVTKSHKIFYSKFITNSSNIWFSTNMIGCEECILCENLENKRYYIKNKEYSYEEYLKMKVELMQNKSLFTPLYEQISNTKARNIGSENVSGNNIIKAHDTKNGFWINNIHNSHNVVIGNGGDSCDSFYDAVDVGLDSNNFYGASASGYKTHHIYCSSQIGESSYLYYCYFVESCHHCLGCIGLKNKSYCILNKQYTKQEWEILAEKIFASMEADGTLGDFFPASMNPFYFNDTLAYLIDDSFTKEEVEKEGFLWRDEPIRADIPEGVRIVKNTELDQFQGWTSLQPSSTGERVTRGHPPSLKEKGLGDEEVWYIDPEILNVVISDEKGNSYRIVKMEYDFLMKHGLPLPRTHWLERIKMGFKS